MSFGWYARKARNSQLPLHVRRSAVRSCILRLSWRTGERFHAAVGRFNKQFHFNKRTSGEGQLLAALTEVERERNLLVERVRSFELKRKKAKREGRRSLTKAEQEALRDWKLLTSDDGPPDWFGFSITPGRQGF